jgi:hypothetical protein
VTKLPSDLRTGSEGSVALFEMSFSRYTVRGLLPEKMGAQLSSRGFSDLITQNQAKRNERGLSPADKFVSVLEDRYCD